MTSKIWHPCHVPQKFWIANTKFLRASKQLVLVYCVAFFNSDVLTFFDNENKSGNSSFELHFISTGILLCRWPQFSISVDFLQMDQEMASGKSCLGFRQEKNSKQPCRVASATRARLLCSWAATNACPISWAWNLVVGSSEFFKSLRV